MRIVEDQYRNVVKHPETYIVPILVVKDDKPRFIGTGFFWDTYLVTAKHVIEKELPLKDGEMFQFMWLAALNPTVYGFTLNAVHQEPFDCILIKINQGLPHYLSLNMRQEKIENYFDSIICFEYSETLIQPAEERPKISFHPLYLKGHTQMALHENQALNYFMSFPSLPGSSGAPAISLDEREVVGVLIGQDQRDRSNPGNLYPDILNMGVVLSSATILTQKPKLIVMAKEIKVEYDSID